MRRLMTSAIMGSSLIAIAAPQVLQAQETADNGETASGGVEDIVVTAQKRNERALDVPITITSLSAATIAAQGIENSANFGQMVPGLQITRSLNSATPFIRGLGNPSGGVGEEGATAIYVDGVYNSTPIANLFDFAGIEQIDVLKGPQGTLFGRNSAAGAIQITTLRPSYDFGMKADIGYGNYDTIRGSAYVTGKVTDNVAMNLLVQGRDQRDAWGENLTTGGPNGKSRFGTIRSKLLWEPGDRTEVTLAGDYYQAREALASRPIVPAAGGFQPPADYYDTIGNLQSRVRIQNYGGSLRIRHEADPFDLVSITARRLTKAETAADIDSLPTTLVHNDITALDKTWTQEFQILSPAGSSVKWVAGVFYLHNVTAFAPLYQNGTAVGTPRPGTGPAFFERYGQQKTNSFAFFGQATVPLFQNGDSSTNLTLGARYSIDDRKQTVFQTSNVPAQDVGTVAPRSVTYSSATYRLALDHKFNRDLMVFASYNTGFKSGLFSLQSYADPPVRPETVDTYEAGFKARLFDGIAQVEASAFYNKFDDIQLRQVLTSGGTRLLNAAKAKSYGIDVSINTKPTDRLTMGGAFEILRSEFTSFPNAPATYPLPATCVAGSTGAPTGGNLATCFIDATGNDLIQAPPFTASANATYSIPVGGGSVDISGAYSYNDGFFWESDNRLRQDAFSIVNASVTWRAPDDRYQVRLWGQNLFNEKRLSFAASTARSDGGSPAQPRTYGVTLSVKFGS